ncbi:MAG: transketolase-like TK C-terminal-containing protein, partial [Candidatus Adiutrix sp.]
PYGATFLVFSDFTRPALRLAALMKLRTIFIFTHDSVGVGEDGPTHQPIEHLTALRAIPGLTVIRPADAYETAAAWQCAVEYQGPTVLALSRQNLPVLHPDEFPSVATFALKGGYILSEAVGGPPQVLIIATGSEVPLALKAQKLLTEKGQAVRVVSMPSWEIFDRQDDNYKNLVLPQGAKKLSVEAGLSMGWERYVGPGGKSLSIETFGYSAPAEKIFKELGFTAENIVHLVETM